MSALTKSITALVAALLSWLTVRVVEPVAARFRVTPFSTPLTELLALLTAMPSMLRLASLASLEPAVSRVAASAESPALLPEPALTVKALATPVLVEVSSNCAPFAPLTMVACTPGLLLDWLIAVTLLPRETPGLRLSAEGTSRLGRSSWLRSRSEQTVLVVDPLHPERTLAA